MKQCVTNIVENEYGPQIGKVGETPVPHHSVTDDGKLTDLKACGKECGSDGSGHWSGH